MVVGAVIKWFASPGATPTGLTWDGKTLWHCDLTTDRIYQINPITGAVIKWFASPGAIPRGLTWDGKTLWHCDSIADRIYQLETH